MAVVTTLNSPIASIVIRARNEEKHIGLLLSKIKEQTLKNIEIILIDSGSTDKTIEIASTYPNVTIKRIAAEKFTYGYALNVGCELAKAPYVIFASAHTYPCQNDWIEKLISPLKDPKTALTYGGQRGTEENYFSERLLFLKLFPSKKSDALPAPFCNNANAAIKKSIWETLRYDESLPGLEDLHWSNQAIQNGWKIDYVPEAVIYHIHEENFRQIVTRFEREAIAFKAIYSHETLSLLGFLYQIFDDIRGDIGSKGFKIKYLLEILKFRLASNLGAYCGLKNHLNSLSYPFHRTKKLKTTENLTSTQHTIEKAA